MLDFSKLSKRALNVSLMAILLASFQIFATGAHAADCKEKASEVASSTGGRVLSVKTEGENCVIKVLVESENSPPRRKTVVVPK